VHICPNGEVIKSNVDTYMVKIKKNSTSTTSGVEKGLNFVLSAAEKIFA
jgi:hypothetical protein